MRDKKIIMAGEDLWGAADDLMCRVWVVAHVWRNFYIKLIYIITRTPIMSRHMKISELLFATVLGLSFVASAKAACYTIYKGESAIFSSSVSPVDMSLPFSQTVPAKFGEGATMVYQENFINCPELEITNAVSVPAALKVGANAMKSGAIKELTISPSSVRIEDRYPSLITSAEYSGSYDHGSAYGSRGSIQRGSIQTGPRGGQYFINSNGNRSYVGSGGSRGSRGR